MARVVDGCIVCTSTGYFLASFASGQSGLVASPHMENLGKACDVQCGIFLLAGVVVVGFCWVSCDNKEVDVEGCCR